MQKQNDMAERDLIQSCNTLLAKIPGVFSANVCVDSLGELSDIHILATTRRNTKQISKDIQAAVAAAFQKEIDHRIISIAQIEGDRYGGVCYSEEFSPVRLRYSGMNVYMHEGKRTYEVRLCRDEQEFVGTSECANSPRQKQRAVAQATIMALEGAIGLNRQLNLLMVHTVEMEGISVVFTVIECPASLDGRLLIGAAHLNRNDDEAECVVRATLDALNRFCGRLAASL